MSFCKPELDILPRSWGAKPTAAKSGDTTVPISFKFALLAPPSPMSPRRCHRVAQHFSTGAYKAYMDAATSGCVDYTIDAYEVPLGTQKIDGNCAITHPRTASLTAAG